MFFHGLIFMYFVQYFDVFLFVDFRHGYLKQECPVLRATPTMAAFLDYDFLPTRETVHVSEDFHSILGLPVDSEENETTLYYDDYIDDSSHVEPWENVSYISTLPSVDIRQDNINFMEASTVMPTEKDLISHHISSPSTQNMEDNHITINGGNATSLNTEDNQTYSFTTSSTLL